MADSLYGYANNYTPNKKPKAPGDWLSALNARSAGLNKAYGLPRKTSVGYTPPTAPAAQEDEDPYGVNAMIAAMLAAVQQEKDAAYAQAQREAEMEYAKGQAVAQGLKHLGISDAVQKAFGNAATTQAGLAQGFSGNIREQAAAQAAEQQRMLSGTGQEGAVRNQGEAMGNVSYGMGGHMPATALNTMAAAFGADAALQPGFALQFGQMAEAARRQQWADEELPEWTKQITSVLDKKPGMLADAEEQAYERALDLAKLNKSSSSSTSSKVTYRNLANGQIGVFRGGKMIRVEGPPKAEKTASEKVTFRNLANGQIQRFDSAGNAIGNPVGPPRAAAKKAKSKGYNLQFKDFGGYHQWVDPRSGKPVGQRYPDPKASSSSRKSAGRPDGMTPTQVRRARADAYTGVKAWWENGMKNAEGVSVKPQDILKEMINEGAIPFDIAVRQLAKFYKPAAKWYSDTKKAVKPEKGAKIMPASFRSTHETDNLGWPAVDIMGSPGQPVASPVSGRIVRHGSAQGGQALYLLADDGTMYWLGHIDDMLPPGTRVRKGQTIARISADHARPHVHLAKQSGSRS